MLIDQVFKEPNWSKQLRDCYDKYDKLKIVFTGSSVMRLKEENPELNGIVKSYNLRGFSFREFLNLQTGNNFRPYTMKEIKTSRATVMNYIKYLADARLINMIYPIDHSFPKKPTKVMMHNSNLIYAIYPIKVETQDVMETFLVNSLWKDHLVNQSGRDNFYTIDGDMKFRVCDANDFSRIKPSSDTIYARYNTEVGKGNEIPLWLFGFLY